MTEHKTNLDHDEATKKFRPQQNKKNTTHRIRKKKHIQIKTRHKTKVDQNEAKKTSRSRRRTKKRKEIIPELKK